MKVHVKRKCANYRSYRAARVKSLFNAERGDSFEISADLPIEEDDWRIGLIVGPSGSGKTTLASELWGGGFIAEPGAGWSEDKPIVDCIREGEADAFDQVTGALAAVGLGSVPSWLRPYHVLSNGEKFRADMARVVCEQPERVIVDEFTSVVDRQIAKIGAAAFSKAWKRTAKQCIVVTCHYDVIEWLQPDWIFDTADGSFARGCLQPRPTIELEVWRTDWRHWPLFKPHYYLDLPLMPAAAVYVGTVEGEPVAHLGVATRPAAWHREGLECRGSRMVVMPEWQGAGVGTKFLDAVCELQLQGHDHARMPGRELLTQFHTSHPGLVAALRRSPKWRQISAAMFGGSKARSRASMLRSQAKRGVKGELAAGYGGHFRAIQGFRYYGQAGVEAAAS